jgi:hypothetical protein
MTARQRENDGVEVERTLPDDQQQIDDDADDEETQLQRIETAQNVARQFEEIKDRTVDENTALGIVKKIETSPGNNRIHVYVDLPDEDSLHQYPFKRPKLWSPQYKFVRWVTEYGYDADSFPSMIEDNCEVKLEDDDDTFDLYIPDRTVETPKPLKDRIEWAYELYAGSAVYVGELIGLGVLAHGIAAFTQLSGTLGIEPEQYFGVWLLGVLSTFIVLFIEDAYLKSND